MCEFCEKGYENKPIYEDEYSTIEIDEDSDLDIDYDEHFGYDSMYYHRNIKINYCPMCGRKLKNDH